MWSCSVRKLIEAHPKEEAQGCEEDNAVAHSETVLGRMCQAPAELSIQSFSSLGSKKTGRWHASWKLISLHAFRHSHIRGERWLSFFCVFLCNISLSISYWNLCGLWIIAARIAAAV